jgi:hypothetical protein
VLASYLKLEGSSAASPTSATASVILKSAINNIERPDWSSISRLMNVEFGPEEGSYISS